LRLDYSGRGDLFGVLFQYQLGDETGSSDAKGSIFLVDGRELIELYDQAAEILEDTCHRFDDLEPSELNWEALLGQHEAGRDLMVDEAIKSIQSVTIDLARGLFPEMDRLLERRFVAQGQEILAVEADLEALSLSEDDRLALGPQLIEALFDGEENLLSLILDEQGIAALCSGARPSMDQVHFLERWNVIALARRTKGLLRSPELWQRERDRSIKVIENLLKGRTTEIDA
jgi:hypothetical protein